jgi:hypothetical protein
MSLQHELDALRAELVRTAPPGRATLYDAKVKELRRIARSRLRRLNWATANGWSRR